MGLFKSIGKAVKGVTKPFKKILRSPIGKAAMMYAMWHFGPAAFKGGEGLRGLTGWKAVAPKWLYTAGTGAPTPSGASGILGHLGNKWSSMGTLGKAATIGGATMAAGALGDDVLEEKKTVIDDSGHKGYLNSRKMFVDEWTEWLIDQGHDPDEARAMAEKELFAKAEGGIVGLAQGGRIGMAEGWPGPGVGRDTKGYKSDHTSYTGPDPTPDKGPQIFPKKKPIPTKDNRVKPRWGSGITTFTDWVNNTKFGQWNKTMQHRNFLEHLQKTKPEAYEEAIGDLIKTNYASRTGDVVPPSKGFREVEFKDFGESGVTEILNAVGPTGLYTNYLNRNNVPTTGGDGPQNPCDGPNPPAYCFAGTGGGGAPADTTADYYGFKEWEDWGGAEGPLFDDATEYKGLLSKGGRIGLYAGGMGAMNSPMNPMMNQGLGAMGSQGMNPFNQQNLQNQAQMRGQPTGMPGGRPPMPGGPTTARGPGITGSQAAAELVKKEEDTELIQLIKMLASMGIPMEQLRGRTKEELVEMVMSLSAKAQAQGGGEEVIEEQEEVVEANRGGRIGYDIGSGDPLLIDEYKKYVFEMEEQGLQPMSFEQFEAQARAGQAHGGRIHAAGGLGEMYPPQGSYPNSDLEFQTDEQASMVNPGDAEMYSEDDEEEIYIQRATGGRVHAASGYPNLDGGMRRHKILNEMVDEEEEIYVPKRVGKAMGTEQPIIPSKDGPQIDYRGIGGYQPHGAKEKKDDVRALLAQGEFVVTSDAVKGIGGGDRDVGAKRMYDMMHKYEPIGRALS